MTKFCFFCKEIIKELPYRCKYCGLEFCSKHRIPESHSCIYDLNVKFEKVLYEDALDFMQQKLTVAKIYEYVTKKELNKAEALELLTFFIESTSEIDNRIYSIAAFELIGLNSKEAYEVLEHCLISDENYEVRKITAKVLSKIFPQKSKALLRFALTENLI